MNKAAIAVTLIVTNIATFTISKMLYSNKNNASIVAESPYISLVESFYEAINTPPSENTAQMFSSIISPSWVLTPPLEGENNVEGIIKSLGMQYNVAPNMKVTIQEMIYAGNRIIVKTKISGTPNGQFMGVNTNGLQSFEIDGVDIHTIKDSRISETQRSANWNLAIAQIQDSSLIPTSIQPITTEITPIVPAGIENVANQATLSNETPSSQMPSSQMPANQMPSSEMVQLGNEGSQSQAQQ